MLSLVVYTVTVMSFIVWVRFFFCLFLFQGLISGFKTSEKISVFLCPHSVLIGCLDKESDSDLGSFVALH